MSSDFGIYIHIPFCEHLCHYCDFAKTARWDEDAVRAYFAKLAAYARLWCEQYFGPTATSISSVNIGGGTPGLFTCEFERLINIFRPFLANDAEISLEANPNNCSEEALTAWRQIGFNRLSIGIQTLDQDGLRFLKRDHSSQDGVTAVRRAKTVFEKINADLIYGWSGQTATQWQRDLEVLGNLVPHLSLYTLTYAPQTPIGRAHHRGILAAPPDENLSSMYDSACATLKHLGFAHDEVSNWAQPDHTCRHNWLYWQQGYFVGIGTGAWGFVPDAKVGLRYRHTDRLRRFLDEPASINALLDQSPSVHDSILIDRRDEDAWLTEAVGCGLRSSRGVDLELVESVVGKRLLIDGPLDAAFQSGTLAITDDRRLILSPREWFRETAWSIKVLEAFT